MCIHQEDFLLSKLLLSVERFTYVYIHANNVFMIYIYIYAYIRKIFCFQSCFYPLNNLDKVGQRIDLEVVGRKIPSVALEDLQHLRSKPHLSSMLMLISRVCYALLPHNTKDTNTYTYTYTYTYTCPHTIAHPKDHTYLFNKVVDNYIR